MGERQWVDQSAASCLAVCSCGWRQLVSTRMAGHVVNLEHANACHPGDTRQAQQRLCKARSRQGEQP